MEQHAAQRIQQTLPIRIANQFYRLSRINRFAGRHPHVGGAQRANKIGEYLLGQLPSRGRGSRERAHVLINGLDVAFMLQQHIQYIQNVLEHITLH